VACGLLMLLPPATAYASTIFTYAQGVGGVGGVFHTTGFAQRDLNRVYHNEGRTWTVCYQKQDLTLHGCVTNSLNPTVQNNNTSYDMSRCVNVNDNSLVTWTCQTTRP
jgi:hypothetical protein